MLDLDGLHVLKECMSMLGITPSQWKIVLERIDPKWLQGWLLCNHNLP